MAGLVSRTLRTIVIAVGRLRPPFQDDVQHYLKMLAGRTNVEVVELREEEKVPGRIPERAYVVVLDADGQEMDSLGFSKFIEERRMSGQDLCFVIGGPRGLDLGDAHMKLSFGRMTLPHQLARVVLLEQLYRAHKIIAREPYHY
jgi:23S rRNA (pseudouridine1915-N3)-methyltransferase